MASYDEEFKKRIVRKHMGEGRTIRSLSEKYHVSEKGIGYWLKKYREECSKRSCCKGRIRPHEGKPQTPKGAWRNENNFLKKRQHSSFWPYSISDSQNCSRSLRSPEPQGDIRKNHCQVQETGTPYPWRMAIVPAQGKRSPWFAENCRSALQKGFNHFCSQFDVPGCPNVWTISADIVSVNSSYGIDRKSVV